MSCPNCGRQLLSHHLDNQTVLHCANCGGSFLEENGINRISLKSSVQLAADKKNDEISGEHKRCPKDGHRLAAILNDEAVPQNVTLLRCPRCRGIFAFSDDLVQFKKAQSAKVGYYKMWETPLSSIRTVVVLSFIAIVSAGLFFTFNAVQNNTSQQIQASDQVKNIAVNISGRFLFMTFQTNSPTRSQIIFNDKTINKTIVKNITDKPVKNHIFSTTELNLGDELTYQIILYTQNGATVKTPVRKLVVNK